MSKELFTAEINTEITNIVVDAPVTVLDDLHLALISGGEAIIAL